MAAGAMGRDQEWETLADAAFDFCRAICHYPLVFVRSAVGWWVGRDILGLGFGALTLGE
jgi:hypothetical protein